MTGEYRMNMDYAFALRDVVLIYYNCHCPAVSR